MLISELLSKIDGEIPFDYRFNNDPVGLLVGSARTEITGILIALDITEAVILEAVSQNCNLIISHHPLFYHPLKNLVSGNFYTDIVRSLIKNDLALISLHTCFDLQLLNGVSKALALALNLQDIQPMIPMQNIANTKSPEVVKLAVYLPVTHQAAVQEAIHSSGGAVIGNYDNCFFTFAGSGSFRGNHSSNPYIGKKEEIAHVEEIKLETVVFRNRLPAVLAAVRSAHPYEEPAIDIYALESAESGLALGCTGNLPQPMCADELKAYLKKSLSSENIRFALNPQISIYTKIAVAGGSCSVYWRRASQLKADLFLTSEIGHHTCLEAKQAISLADVTHFTSEKFCLSPLKDIVAKIYSNGPILISESGNDPFDQ